MGQLPWWRWPAGLLVVGLTVLLSLALVFPTFPGDQWLLLTMQGWRMGALDTVALTVSMAGWIPVSVAMVGATAGWMLWLGRRRDTLMVLLILLAVAAGHGLKLLVQRPRPEFLVIGPAPGGYSFPSGHALFAALLGGLVVALVGELVRPTVARRTVQGLVVLMVLAVGASRVYLGAHWPSDVLGGYLLGVLGVLALLRLRDRRPTD